MPPPVRPRPPAGRRRSAYWWIWTTCLITSGGAGEKARLPISSKPTGGIRRPYCALPCTPGSSSFWAAFCCGRFAGPFGPPASAWAGCITLSGIKSPTRQARDSTFFSIGLPADSSAPNYRLDSLQESHLEQIREGRHQNINRILFLPKILSPYLPRITRQKY